MRPRPSFALLSAQLLILAGQAVAEAPAGSGAASATAGARILERPVRIVSAELERQPERRAERLPPQAQITTRRCDAPAPPACRLIVIDLP